MPNRLTLLFAATLIALPLSACQRSSTDNEVAEAPDPTGVPSKGVDRSHSGESMPAAEIYNADDETAMLREAAGKPTLVNLWASWCAPCVKELPTLDALARRPGAPKVIVVSEDVGERASVDAFLDKLKIRDVESWRDPKMSLSSDLAVQVMPTTVYYDASGKEVWRYVGDLDWTGEEAAKLLGEAGQRGPN